MQIHVVVNGQTLSAIGKLYGLSPGLIGRFNGLVPPCFLAVGQSLYIPEPTGLYTVRPGDTLSAVARENGTTALQLLRNNPNLAGDLALYPGQVLVLGLENERLGPARVAGYAYPFVDLSVLRGILPYTGALMPFTYGIRADGSLLPLDDGPLRQLAESYGVQNWLHLSTLTEGGGFSTEIARKILTDPALEQRLTEDILRRAADFAGVDVDFEYLSRDLAAPYAAFLGRLRQTLAPLGKKLMAALSPKSYDDQPGLLYEGHDYALVGENVDLVLLMTYEWGYTYGPPMAVAPIASVRRVVEYALTRIEAGKLLLGFPNYGYDWLLPYEAGASRARSIGQLEAAQLAVQYGAEILYDESSATPHFSYTDEEGRLHEVWFEDPRSARAKLELIEEYGLAGVGFWNFMRSFPAGFSVLDSLYEIRPL